MLWDPAFVLQPLGLRFWDPHNLVEHTLTYTNMYTYRHTCTEMHTHMYIFTHTCIQIETYLHIQMYTHTPSHTHHIITHTYSHILEENDSHYLLLTQRERASWSSGGGDGDQSLILNKFRATTCVVESQSLLKSGTLVALKSTQRWYPIWKPPGACGWACVWTQIP